MSKNIYIFGSSGFLGSHIVGELKKKGYSAITLTRKQIDLEDSDAPEKVRETVEKDSLIVLAAAQAPAKTGDDLIANIIMLNNLMLGLDDKIPSYILNISSDAVFSDTKVKLVESSLRAPTSFHGIMHCMRESALDQKFEGKVGHIRPTLVFGPGDPHNGYGPNSFLRKATALENISIFGQGEELRDHIHVDDVSRIAVEMLLKRYVGPLNAVTGTVFSFREIAEKALSNRNKNGKIISKPRSGPMPHGGYRAFDNSSLMKFMPDLRFTSVIDYL